MHVSNTVEHNTEIFKSSVEEMRSNFPNFDKFHIIEGSLAKGLYVFFCSLVQWKLDKYFRSCV